MKSCFTRTLFVCLFSVSSLLIGKSALGDQPKGFEDPVLMAKVMKGEIVSTLVTETELEKRVVLRAFYKGATPKRYVMDAATNHKRYPVLFPNDIVKGDTKTVKAVSATETEYTYSMEMIFSYGPFTLHAYPEGKQVATLPEEAGAEAKVEHVITNYKDLMEVGEQHTRLIPWEDGFLIEDDLHVKLIKNDAKSKAIKQQMITLFSKFLEGFRKDLGAKP